MATNYPGSFDDFTAISGEEMGDSVGGRTHEDFHNDANDAIEAIEGELGATPSGASATVAARLTGIEADVTAAGGDASANAEAIATNSANIATNTGDIATNAADIATNTGDISANATAVEGKANGTALDLLGISGNYASTPYSAGMSVTGDLDLRWFGSLNDALAGNNTLISRYPYTGTQNTYMFASISGDNLRLIRSTDGTAGGAGEEVNSSGSMSGFGVDMTEPVGVRVTWEQSSGLVKFWSSADNGITWTQRGASQAGGTGATFDSTTEPALIGTYSGTAWKLGGVTTRAEVRDGIDGTIVVNPDFTQGTVGPDGAGNVWTINGSGVYVYADGSAAPVFDIGANTTDILVKANGSGLRTTGTAGEGATAPYSSSFNSFANLDVQWFGTLDDWTASSTAALVGRTDPGQRQFMLAQASDGGISAYFYNAADDSSQVTSPAPSFADGAYGGIRMTYTGAGQTVRFYTSDDDGATWDALGSALALTAITVNKNSTSALTVGASGDGTSFILEGVTHRVVVNNGFGGSPVLLASPNFTTSENTKRTDVQGNVWTVDGGTFETVSGLTLATDTGNAVDNAAAIVGKANGTALSLPGTTGNYASAPYTVGNTVTGDLDIRWVGALDDWVKPASSNTLISQWTSGGSGANWYMSAYSGSDFLRFTWSDTGDSGGTTTVYATEPVPFADGGMGGVRATLDVSSGDVAFYTSTDEGSTWAQLGTTVGGAGATSTGVADVAIAVGGYLSGSLTTSGTVKRAEVRDGIGGTIVASPDFTRGTIGKDGAGNVWTLNGSAGYVYADGHAAPVQGSYVDETVGRRAFTWDAVNGRWQMTYGSTGMRRLVTGDLDSSFTATNSVTGPWLTRTGNTVTLEGSIGIGSASADALYTLPDGFKSRRTVVPGVWVSTTGTRTTQPITTSTTGAVINIEERGATGGSTVRFSASWVTNDAWPASLPGVADGDIPSGFVEFIQTRNPTLGTADLVEPEKKPKPRSKGAR